MIRLRIGSERRMSGGFGGWRCSSERLLRSSPCGTRTGAACPCQRPRAPSWTVRHCARPSGSSSCTLHSAG
eukprot:scaffold11495_cov132-Isochrysis_galbana.AAC.3